MKNKLIRGLSLGLCLCLSLMLIACTNTSKETQYNIIKSDKEYLPYQPSAADMLIDGEITVDGVFDEDLYSNLNWYEGYKNYFGRTATLRTTTHMAKNGILIAAHVEEGWLVSHDVGRNTAQNSGIEFYFALGDAARAKDNLLEIEITAMQESRIRIWNGSSFQLYAYAPESAPTYAVTREGGSIASGECTGFSIELYMPYSMFNKTKRPEFVFINPGLITPLMPTGTTLDWYVFGLEQSPEICGWAQVEAYVFDKNGFVSNDIEIAITGDGIVIEEYGYNWCVTDDRINFYVFPDLSATLASFKVNGVEKVSEVDADTGLFSMICSGDIKIEAVFSSLIQ